MLGATQRGRALPHAQSVSVTAWQYQGDNFVMHVQGLCVIRLIGLYVASITVVNQTDDNGDVTSRQGIHAPEIAPG